MVTFRVLLLLLFISKAGFGQEITRIQANSMINRLKEERCAPTRTGLLLNLAQFHIFKPGENQADFDSAMVFIRDATALVGTSRSSATYGYLQLTRSYLVREKGEREEGRKLAREAIRVLRSTDSAYYLGRAYYELSNYYDFNDSIEVSERISLVRKSVAAFQKAGAKLETARSLEMLGDLYITTGDLVTRIEILKQALATYDSINYPGVQGVYVLLGDSYEVKGDHEQALFFLLKSLRLTQSSGIQSMQLCQINYALGMLYHKIHMCDRELSYLLQSVAIARENKDEWTTGLVMAAMASAYYDLDLPNKMLDVLDSIPRQFRSYENPTARAFVAAGYLKSYMKLKQFDRARPYCDTMLSIVDNKKQFMEYQTSSAYRTAAAYLLLTKEYQKSRYYLNKSKQITKRTNRGFDLIQEEQLLYKLDSAQGDFTSAFRHLNTYKAKMDSVNSERKVRQFEVMAVEYQLEMKEDSIKLKNKDILLLTQQNTLQQANLKQTSLVKNVTLAGIVLVLIITGFLYRQYRSKQKNNNVITEKNNQLEHYLLEKEWLLKEIHHRVKNNLQMVMSLLNSQSAYINNQPALTAIHDSQHRIHSMSLIHQKLYNADNLSTINISSYIRELVSYLVDSFDSASRIRFEFAIDPLEMDVSQAIPVGLILNEAITNALKYAFPDERTGTVFISLSASSPTHYLLVIADNGIGLPSDMDIKKNGSLGMSLMEGLSEDLDGHFSVVKDKGATIKITFAHPAVGLRVKSPTS